MAGQGDTQARLWFYSNYLGFSGSLPSSSTSSGGHGESAIVPKVLNPVKHWAVVLEYMRIKDPIQVNKRVLYEADNERGLLVAKYIAHGEDEEEEWRQKPGFDKQDHGMVTANEARARNYCEGFNQLKIKYVATEDNCQRFVEEFVANVLIDAKISMPTTVREAKSWFSSVASTSLASLSNFGSAALVKDYVLKSRIGEGPLEMMVKEAIKQLNLNGFGKVSILAESPLKEYMAEEGKQLVLTTFGEVTENVLNASRGAFTWWNLLQIPVELIVGKLMKSAKFTDLEAYGGKKLASCLTAAGVGGFAGGPAGSLASVALWIATEVIATFVKCLLAKMFGDGFSSIFGESETLELIKSIYRYFEIKITCGLNASLKRMMDYMESTQSRQKKLA